jgi:UDP-N-acetylmuramoyl-tripeptide--D-alanyl-D-alanine ligase
LAPTLNADRHSYPALPLAAVLTGTGGELVGPLAPGTIFPRIERNSRLVARGDLFLAIRGDRLDGHAFVTEAAERGAAAALVARDWIAAAGSPPLPVIVVDDTVAALQRWARAHRLALPMSVVGITGSVGKTSTKEVVAAVLGQRFTTYRSPGNLNTEIGLPLSLLETGPRTDVAVLEMGGAYAFGELTLLASIAQPNIAVVTNVFPVHLERMGSIEAIAETKAELVDAVPADGAAVLNGDDHRVRAMAARCRGRVVTYGLTPNSEVWASQVSTEALEGTSFWLHLAGDRLHVRVPLVGGHAVQLALAALAVGHAMGMHVSEMLPGFDEPAIQVRLLVQPGPHGSRLIDDTYNASTPSMLSALSLLADLRRGNRYRRAIAVLGDMRELGSLAEGEHRVVGRRAGEVADVVLTYGELARIIAEEARKARHVDGRAPDVTSFGLDQRGELVDHLQELLREGDVVLLKGSRGLLMEEMVAALRDDAGSAGGGSDRPV